MKCFFFVSFCSDGTMLQCCIWVDDATSGTSPVQWLHFGEANSHWFTITIVLFCFVWFQYINGDLMLCDNRIRLRWSCLWSIHIQCMPNRCNQFRRRKIQINKKSFQTLHSRWMRHDFFFYCAMQKQMFPIHRRNELTNCILIFRALWPGKKTPFIDATRSISISMRWHMKWSVTQIPFTNRRKKKL